MSCAGTGRERRGGVRIRAPGCCGSVRGFVFAHFSGAETAGACVPCLGAFAASCDIVAISEFVGCSPRLTVLPPVDSGSRLQVLFSLRKSTASPTCPTCPHPLPMPRGLPTGLKSVFLLVSCLGRGHPSWLLFCPGKVLDAQAAPLQLLFCGPLFFLGLCGEPGAVRGRPRGERVLSHSSASVFQKTGRLVGREV